MIFKGKFSRYLKLTDGPKKQIDFEDSAKSSLYLETLEHVFLMLDDGTTTEAIKQKVNEYLVKYNNDYDRARKYLFNDMNNLKP